jgi:hypothetical protein
MVCLLDRSGFEIGRNFRAAQVEITIRQAHASQTWVGALQKNASVSRAYGEIARLMALLEK